jgi:hypothetical protein
MSEMSPSTIVEELDRRILLILIFFDVIFFFKASSRLEQMKSPDSSSFVVNNFSRALYARPSLIWISKEMVG